MSRGEMNKSYRRGVDLKVAFSAETRDLHQAAATHVCAKCLNEQAGFSTHFLKPIFRRIYGLLKHPLRPLTSRFRRYMIQDLTNELSVLAQQQRMILVRLNTIEHYTYLASHTKMEEIEP